MTRQPLRRQLVAAERAPSIARLLAVAAAWIAAPLALAADSVRVATFNVSLYGESHGQVLARLAAGDDSQARHLAEIIQRVQPEILLLNEIDYDERGEVLTAFHDKYLAVSQNVSGSPAGGAKPIKFAHRYTAPVNTGRASGFDLSRDGAVEATAGSDAYGADCWGYGRYAGQYGMAILSQHPIDAEAVRTFQNFRWRDMPEARLPDDPATAAPSDWFPQEAIEKFPLSSKSHWDVPINVNGRRIHLLVCHPTPPVYDGAEDRNGKRNHDEIRFWVDYIGPADGAAYLYDDKGTRGGIRSQETGDRGQEGVSRDAEAERAPGEPSFLILGDLNGDSHDGDGKEGIAKLLASPAVLAYPAPESPGGVEQAVLQGGANQRQRGNPAQDTCDPADDPGPGNLRLDYVLPSRDLQVAASGVFWPAANDPLFKLAGVHPFPSSDHRLVWVDLEVPASPTSAAKVTPLPMMPTGRRQVTFSRLQRGNFA